MDFDQIVAKYPGERYQAHLGLLFHTNSTVQAQFRSMYLYESRELSVNKSLVLVMRMKMFHFLSAICIKQYNLIDILFGSLDNKLFQKVGSTFKRK